MSEKTLLRSLILLTITVLGIIIYSMVVLRGGAKRAALDQAIDPTIEPIIEPMVETTQDPENLYSEFYVPDFELIDRYGETITHKVLDGQYTVVDFFFTSCPLWCPGMTQAMRKVQQATYGTSLRFMSISIDGDVDTPAAIDEYASRYGSDEERWHYATGDPAIVASMVMDGLKFDLGDPSDTQDSGRLINHPTRLILLGPDRKVIGLYRYDDPDEVDKLIADAKKLVN
ncbi:MAG: SCO family protein [Phycisphaerales bacterium]|nr:SCO family protein [Phycisphaerales bacterium]